MNKRRCYRMGPLSWCRDEWALLLVEMRCRVFGFFWQRVSGDLTVILGCKVLERSALGYPRSFVGGLHMTLRATSPFVVAGTSHFDRITRRPDAMSAR